MSMLAAKALFPDLEEIIRDVSPERTAKAIQRIGALFAEGAQHFNPQHVELFDGVLKGLLTQTDGEARAELALRLASLVNAPPSVVRELVQDDAIRVAGPLLKNSPLVDETTLIEVARKKGQQHLLAISKREAISPNVTDVIVSRGERVVARSVARNATAAFSEQGYSSLVERAADDGMLAVAMGQREDLPAPLLQKLLSEAADLVRRKIFEAAGPEQKTRLARTMVEMSGDGGAQNVERDFAAAQRAVVVLHKAGRLNQEALVRFARDRKYEEAVAALSALSGLTVETVDQVVCGGKRDSVLILGRAIRLDWATVRALLALRLPPGRALSTVDAESARVSFERLALPTAQRVMKFWKERPPLAPPLAPTA
jgi:uncharacterized protein (DUF2336 family)